MISSSEECTEHILSPTVFSSDGIVPSCFLACRLIQLKVKRLKYNWVCKPLKILNLPIFLSSDCYYVRQQWLPGRWYLMLGEPLFRFSFQGRSVRQGVYHVLWLFIGTGSHICILVIAHVLSDKGRSWVFPTWGCLVSLKDRVFVFQASGGLPPLFLV